MTLTVVLSLPRDRFSQIPLFITIRATDRIYPINLTTQPNSFTLHAVPQLSQSGIDLSGTLSLTSTGLRTASGSGFPSDSW